MESDRPESYDKRVLVMVSGMNPQIITETLFALTQRRTPAFVPTRLFVLTTSEGAERVRLTLQSKDGTGWLARLRRDYELPDITFGSHDIRVLSDPSGRPLVDIRTTEESEAAANQIVDTIREFTSDDKSAVHVLFNGGRANMGYFVGYALSLYGRRQDRLSQVLVSPEFEQNNEFFYPTPRQRIIYDKTGQPLDANKAEVLLADTPFVRMREGLPDTLRTGRVTYAEAVDALRGRLESARLRLSVTRREVTAGGSTFTLPKQNFTFYLWIAKSQKFDGRFIRVHSDGSTQKIKGVSIEQTLEFLDIYGQYADTKEKEKLFYMERNGMSPEEFRNRLSALRGILSREIDEPLPQRYLVNNFGKRGAAAYGLDLPDHAIEIVE